MIQNDLSVALAELCGSKERPVAARLREVLPMIEAALSAGATRKQVLKVLNENGFQLELGVFVTNLHRLRKKGKQQRQKSAAKTVRSLASSSGPPKPTLASAGGTVARKNPLSLLSQVEPDQNLDPRRDIGLPFERNEK